ncbi:MAG: hypothetical protein Q9M43_02845 [Sulfurimonas sp.]|nr:hypothetical protein [Sulfurimonas sp.]
MENIEQKAVEIYTNNIIYFRKNHPKLMQKLDVLDAMIESGDYASHYDLEYIHGYFDVKELQSAHYLYNDDSQLVSSSLADLIDFKKLSLSFEGFPLYNISADNQKTLDDRAEGFEDILPIMKYYVDHTSPDDLMKKIEKFMFVGVGLGMHIECIHTKIQAKEYFIIEDDLELFKLSLFTTSYSSLGKWQNFILV